MFAKRSAYWLVANDATSSQTFRNPPASEDPGGPDGPDGAGEPKAE